MAAAGVGPHEAQSNLSHWLGVAGWDWAANITKDVVVDQKMIIFCFILLALSVVPSIMRAMPDSAFRIARMKEDRGRFYAKRMRVIGEAIRDIRNGKVDAPPEEALEDEIRSGHSLLLLMSDDAYTIPKLEELETSEQQGIALQEYFKGLRYLLVDGHVSRARSRSKQCSAAAMKTAKGITPEDFYGW